MDDDWEITNALLKSCLDENRSWIYWAEVNSSFDASVKRVDLSAAEYSAEIRRRSLAHSERLDHLRRQGEVSFTEALLFTMQAPLLSKESKPNLKRRTKPNNILRSARVDRLLRFEWKTNRPENFHRMDTAAMNKWSRENMLTSLDNDEVENLINDASDQTSASRVESFETLEFLCVRWLERERICSKEVHLEDPVILGRLNDAHWSDQLEPYDIGLTLRKWLADFLLGRIKKPSRKGQRKDANHSRDMKIVSVLKDLESIGIRPTRNRESSDPCGIDAVIEAVSKNWGMNFSYAALETVWHARRKPRPE